MLKLLKLAGRIKCVDLNIYMSCILGHPKSTDEIAAISKWTDQIGSKSLRNLYEKVFKLKDAHISSSRSTVNDVSSFKL